MDTSSLELGAKFPPPTYLAVTACDPTDNDAAVNVATAPAPDAARVPDPILAPPS